MMLEFFKNIGDKLVSYVEKIPYFSESNRAKHFVYAIPFGFISLLFVLGLAIGMEYKDKLKGGLFDIHDLIATLLGGIVGKILFLIAIVCLYKLGVIGIIYYMI